MKHLSGKFVPVLAVIAAAIALISWWMAETANSGSLLKPGDRKIVELGKQVYAEQCAACHGEKLEGQPDWMSPGPDGLLPAPPHDETGHTWHHTDTLLFELTKFGIAKLAGLENHKTNMPAYENLLTDEEIIAVLSFIKSTWPPDVRSRHDQMNALAGEQEPK